MVYLTLVYSKMCIEIFVDKVLVFSKCESSIINTTNVSFSYENSDNRTISTPKQSPNLHQKNISNPLWNTSVFNSTHIPYNNQSYTMYNISPYLYNMTVVEPVEEIIKENSPNYTPTPNITVNRSEPIAFNAPAPDQVEENTSVVFLLNIILPLFFAVACLLAILVYKKNQKTKVQCVDIKKNSTLTPDVETPKNVEHKNPDVRISNDVEHKNEDVRAQVNIQEINPVLNTGDTDFKDSVESNSEIKDSPYVSFDYRSNTDPRL